MKLLLDTHVVIWWALANHRVKGAWLEPIVDDANTVYVSAASAWEVEIKRRQGRMPLRHSLVEVSSEYGFELLPMTATDGVTAGALDWDHRDPFDRMLAAQSLDHRLVLVTDDPAFATAPGIRTL